MLEHYRTAVEYLEHGISLATSVVEGNRTQEGYHALMAWLSRAPLEFGIAVIRLVAKESDIETAELFGECGDLDLVGEVTSLYGPLLAVIMQHERNIQEKVMESALQAVFEHDCENCPARDECPDSTWKGDETVDAELVEDGDDGVEDPRAIDLSKFKGTRH